MYLSVTATAIDKQDHHVQLYSDITAEWISGDRTKVATWETITTATEVYHQASLQSPEPMTEINDIAEDSTVYYAMQTVCYSPALNPYGAHMLTTMYLELKYNSSIRYIRPHACSIWFHWSLEQYTG